MTTKISADAPPVGNVRAFWAVWLSCFFFFSGMTSLWPALPFLALRLGADPLTVGLFVAALPATGWAFALFFGRLADRVDNKTLLLIVQLVALLTQLCYGLAGSLVVLVAMRMVHGVSGALMGLFQTIIANYLGEKQRGKGLAILGMIFGGGLITGTSLSALVLKHDLLTITTIPAMGACLMAISLIINIFFLPRIPTRRKAVATQSLSWSALLPFFIVLFILQIGFTGMEATFGVWLHDIYTLGPATLGAILASAGVANIMGHGCFGGLNRFVKPKLLALCGLGFVMVGAVILIWNPVYGAVYMGMTVLSFGVGIFLPAQQNLVASRAGSSLGAALGSNQSFYQIARITGPLVVGFLYKNIDPSVPFVFLALLTALMLAFVSYRW